MVLELQRWKQEDLSQSKLGLHEMLFQAIAPASAPPLPRELYPAHLAWKKSADPQVVELKV